LIQEGWETPGRRGDNVHVGRPFRSLKRARHFPE
jgi:hypothetical protein